MHVFVHDKLLDVAFRTVAAVDIVSTMGLFILPRTSLGLFLAYFPPLLFARFSFCVVFYPFIDTAEALLSPLFTFVLVNFFTYFTYQPLIALVDAVYVPFAPFFPAEDSFAMAPVFLA